MSKRILIIAGEASGDQHATRLVTAVQNIHPDVHFFGMGGPCLAAVGVEIIVDNKTLAVVGAIEVLSHLRPIIAAWLRLRKLILQHPPDLVILVDYPGFNLQIARLAKKAGCKVLYYISPQVWAWKKRRVKLIKKYVDKMLVVFPFEESFYRQHDVAAEFVGHPLAGEVGASLSIEQARQLWQIKPRQRVIGLLPGSRKGEIRRLLPTLIASAELLAQQYPDLLFILPLASSLSPEDIAPYLSNPNLALRIVANQFYNVLQLCEAAIVTSGTATLETALMGVPLVIVYKTAATTYHIGKYLIKIPYIGLCNIVAEQAIARELIQHQATPQAISAEVSRMISDFAYRAEMKQRLLTVKNNLGKSGGIDNAAQAVGKLLFEA